MQTRTDLKSGDVLTREDASAMARQLLELGLHPRIVRLRLAERGIRWEYVHTGQGGRERLRRLRQQKQGLCPLCGERPYSLTSNVHICETCLERKWSAASKVGPEALDDRRLR